MKVVILIFVILSSIYGIYFNAKKSEVYNYRYTLVENPPLVEFPHQLLSLITLGHRPLYDDILDIWILQILADPKIKKENAESIYNVVIKTLELRPRVETMYMMPCFIFVLDFNRPEFCEKITLLGLDAFPQSWRIPMTQGYVYAFKLNNPIKAAAFYNLAASRQDSPAYVASLAKKLLAKDVDNELLIKETVELMFNVPGGSRFSEFVANTLKNKVESNKEEKQP